MRLFGHFLLGVMIKSMSAPKETCTMVLAPHVIKTLDVFALPPAVLTQGNPRLSRGMGVQFQRLIDLRKSSIDQSGIFETALVF